MVSRAVPLRLVASVTAVQKAGKHEHQVREAIQVLTRCGLDLLSLAERNDCPLRSTADGTTDMSLRRTQRAAGAYELLQPRQCRIGA